MRGIEGMTNNASDRAINVTRAVGSEAELAGEWATDARLVLHSCDDCTVGVVAE